MKITSLRLYTPDLRRQAGFYETVLGLEPAAAEKNTAAFKIGHTTLVFEERENFRPYHFAINIPSRAEVEALDWLKKRRPVLAYEGKELVDFYNWNARSVYFYDADRNIVELIARRNLEIPAQEPFTPQSLLGISEIGMAVENIERTFRKLNELNSIAIYDGSFERFCAAGDEEGLFIIVDRNKKNWLPTSDKAESADFIIGGDFNFTFRDGNIFT